MVGVPSLPASVDAVWGWGGAEVGTVAVCVALRSTFGAHHCGGFAFLSGVILKGVASHTLLDTDDLAECNLMLREEK